ncbi:unnamed protein product [Danaus chrysippus]|uniref:(African queen) hypothetical protein n=1 Tax=Danaus chrysippus TaxID=151541 RepID=A0A8J2RDV4_9NEOP|nr:unnamed protein product [Danaus chrysippus]
MLLPRPLPFFPCTFSFPCISYSSIPSIILSVQGRRVGGRAGQWGTCHQLQMREKTVSATKPRQPEDPRRAKTVGSGRRPPENKEFHHRGERSGTPPTARGRIYITDERRDTNITGIGKEFGRDTFKLLVLVMVVSGRARLVRVLAYAAPGATHTSPPSTDSTMTSKEFALISSLKDCRTGKMGFSFENTETSYGGGLFFFGVNNRRLPAQNLSHIEWVKWAERGNKQLQPLMNELYPSPKSVQLPDTSQIETRSEPPHRGRSLGPTLVVWCMGFFLKRFPVTDTRPTSWISSALLSLKSPLYLLDLYNVSMISRISPSHLVCAHSEAYRPPEARVAFARVSRRAAAV